MRTIRIKAQDYNDVLDYFYSHHDNRTGVIAEKLDLNLSYVSNIIEYALSLKKNYKKPIRNTPQYTIRVVESKILVKDEFNNILGEYNSVTQCSAVFNTQPTYICTKLIKTNKCVIKHWNIGILKYERIFIVC